MQTPAHWRGPDVEAEDAVGEDGEEDEPGRNDRLNERERRKRHRRDVEEPGADRDAHADREPLGGPEVARAPQRVLPLHVRRSAGSTMLEQEGQVREKSAEEREQYADLDGHERKERRGGPQTCDGPAVAIRAIGAGAFPL